MTTGSSRLFTAPIFLGTAFLVFGLAIIEKLLNAVGWSLPFVSVFPRQLLGWATTLLTFEIALMLRQMIELWLEDRGSAPVARDPRLPH
jgi:hypothetical protein